jgi:tRNA(adenine34) deaminase
VLNIERIFPSSSTRSHEETKYTKKNRIQHLSISSSCPSRLRVKNRFQIEPTSPACARPVGETFPNEFMRQALIEAQAAAEAGDVPIGCVIVHDPSGEIVGRGRNRREVDRDPTAHAEIVALRDAAARLGQWRLLDCTLYVTLEPCAMCAGAIVAARVPRLVYGCDDPKAGAVRTLYKICEDERLNHRVAVTANARAEECAEMLRAFFRAQRALGKK